MIRESTPPGDHYVIQCPRLGHLIYFSYCRFENRGLPCFKILDCWYDSFLVEEFLRKELSIEDCEKVFNNPPRSNITGLVELIEQARKTDNG